MIIDCDDTGKSYNIATIGEEPWTTVDAAVNIGTDANYGKYLNTGVGGGANVVALSRALDVQVGATVTIFSGKYRIQDTQTTAQGILWAQCTGGPYNGCCIGWNPDTSISLYESSATTDPIYFTTTPLWPFGSFFGEWHQIEMTLALSSVSGQAVTQVHIDGKLRHMSTVPNSDHAIPFTSLSYFKSNTDIVDFVVLDDTGAINNAPLGPVNVVSIFPNGDTGPNNWTNPGGGDHYLQVNNPVPPGDANYLASGTVNQAEEFSIAPLPGTTSKVYAVRVGASARLNAGGSRSLQFIYDDGVTPVYGASIPLVNNVYSQHYDSVTNMNYDPNTSAAWNVGLLNAKKWGFRLES